MRVVLAELAPRPGDVRANLERVTTVVRAVRGDLVVFPELFLSGYHVGDRLRALALRPDDAVGHELRAVAHATATVVVVGAPVASIVRPGEVENAAVVVDRAGEVHRSPKRYLPTFGPFEEGLVFSPAAGAAPIDIGGSRLGVEICYDVFFPEVARELAVGGAQLLLNISAAPVTSGRLFDKLLPARAVENGLPVVYVNRVGVEDGLVFGGGSAAWDARGEPLPLSPLTVDGLETSERVVATDIDLSDAERWRPFRPVLRDVVARPPVPSPAGR